MYEVFSENNQTLLPSSSIHIVFPVVFPFIEQYWKTYFEVSYNAFDERSCFSTDFNFGNRKKSKGIRSGE